MEGLTVHNGVKLEELLNGAGGEMVLICVVETQHNYKKINFSEKTVSLEKMRNIEDKGGGLAVLMRKQNLCALKQIECEDCNVMRLEVSLGDSVKLNILLVYIDGKAENRMERSYRTLNSLMEKIEESDHIIVL